MNNRDLFEKYDTPVPRYTSYPAVPNWKGNLTTSTWLTHLRQAMNQDPVSWSLYLHLPFCESLCTFCACNNIITRDHTKETRYLDAIHREWAMYLEGVPELEKKPIRQVHLGGGSPTFFNATNLKRLLEPIFSKIKVNPENFEGSVEVDPRRCTFEQLEALREIGFNRISLGVQDFDLEVQKNVNRIQPYEMVENCVRMSRELGYKSLNFDLIYGLPGQTEETILETAKKTVQLRPDRIALYSLAVVPWMKPAQNRFQKMQYETGYNKRKLFEVARDVFLKAGYISLGIDHFALPDDPIAISSVNKSMHRNFMGYTEYSTDVLLGLGMSAISETPNSFHQNLKTIDTYYGALEQGFVLPTAKGHILSTEDKMIQKHILELMTNYSSQFDHGSLNKDDFSDMIAEDIIKIENDKLILTETGVPFTRHVCHRIDRYSDPQVKTKLFSSGI